MRRKYRLEDCQKPGQDSNDGCAKEKCVYYNYKHIEYMTSENYSSSKPSPAILTVNIQGCLELFLGAKGYHATFFHSREPGFNVGKVFYNEKTHSSIRRVALLDMLPNLCFRQTEVDALEQKKTIDQQKHKSKTTDEKRNKNNDRKNCCKIAKEYVENCTAKGSVPSIAQAINIILLRDCGKPYSKGQIRNWINITAPRRIFPKESSKKGRPKNS
jgi:hypothetical protein